MAQPIGGTIHDAIHVIPKTNPYLHPLHRDADPTCAGISTRAKRIHADMHIGNVHTHPICIPGTSVAVWAFRILPLHGKLGRPPAHFRQSPHFSGMFGLLLVLLFAVACSTTSAVRTSAAAIQRNRDATRLRMRGARGFRGRRGFDANAYHKTYQRGLRDRRRLLGQGVPDAVRARSGKRRARTTSSLFLHTTATVLSRSTTLGPTLLCRTPHSSLHALSASCTRKALTKRGCICGSPMHPRAGFIARLSRAQQPLQ